MKIRNALPRRLLTALLLLCSHASAGIIISDNLFNDANWTTIRVPNLTPFTTGTFTFGQVLSGGNPGAYRDASSSGTGEHVFVANLLNTLYDPSTQGAITTLDFGFDVSFPDAALDKPPSPLAFAFALTQGGAYFVRFGGVVPTSATWVSFGENGLIQNNFSKITNAGISPDFSATGAPIQFGYYTDFYSPIPCSSPCATGAIDNWRVAINTPTATPEPGTLAMMAAALCGLAFRVRRTMTVK